MHCEMAVAAAAPTTPHGSKPTNTKSIIMFATPAATVVYKPSFGFSAVIKKV